MSLGTAPTTAIDPYADISFAAPVASGAFAQVNESTPPVPADNMAAFNAPATNNLATAQTELAANSPEAHQNETIASVGPVTLEGGATMASFTADSGAVLCDLVATYELPQQQGVLGGLIDAGCNALSKEVKAAPVEPQIQVAAVDDIANPEVNHTVTPPTLTYSASMTM